MLFYLLLDFVHHVIEVGLLLVLFDKLVDIACSSHLRFTPELARDGSIGGACKVTNIYDIDKQLVDYFLDIPNL